LRLFLLRAALVASVAATILAASACNGSKHSLPTCPPGAVMHGEKPPNGSEVWCEKIVDGKPLKDGAFIVYGISGDPMIRGSYHNGAQDGEWTMYFENGQRAAVDHYANGKQNGLHVSWYANGQTAIEGNYRDGKREGVWMRWDASGLKSQKMIYQNDKIVG
jgi:antitoxin component YwqK of YwqJK toxin-antitoxin module